jgi:hypothetical protein
MKNLSLAVAACFVLVAPCAADDDNQVTLESVRRANAANTAAVRTLVVEEIVLVLRNRTADDEIDTYNRLYRGYDKLTERAIQRLYEISTTSEKETRAAAQQIKTERDGADVEAFMQAWRLNSEELYFQRTTADFTTGRYRFDMRDLRDLEAIAAERQLGALERRNVDRTRTLIGSPNYSLIINADQTHCGVAAPAAGSLKRRTELLGVVPQRLLSGGYEVLFHQNGRSGTATGYWPGTKAVAFTVELEQDSAYRFSRLARYKRSGERTVEILASDHRDVGSGVKIPFRTVTTRARGGDPAHTVELRVVKSVEINTEIPAASFEPPDGIRLQKLDEGAMNAFAERQEVIRLHKP